LPIEDHGSYLEEGLGKIVQWELEYGRWSFPESSQFLKRLSVQKMRKNYYLIAF
jgi:hypothetical protein